jgi:hypothetical protein
VEDGGAQRGPVHLLAPGLLPPIGNKDSSIGGVCIERSTCSLLVPKSCTAGASRCYLPVTRPEGSVTICGQHPGGPSGDQRTFLNRGPFARSSGGQDRTFRHRRHSASLRIAEDVGNCCPFSPPAGLAWVVVGEHRLLAVALRTHVKCGFRIVVACQVLRRIGTPRAGFHSHVPSPKAKQRTSSPSRE